MPYAATSGTSSKAFPKRRGLLGDKIHVETATSFLLALVAAAGGTVPLYPDGSIITTAPTRRFAKSPTASARMR